MRDWLKKQVLALCVVGLSFAPGIALAQVPNQPVPPTRYSLDDRGVDLVTGLFNFTTQEVVIGQPAQGGDSLRSNLSPAKPDRSPELARSLNRRNLA